MYVCVCVTLLVCDTAVHKPVLYRLHREGFFFPPRDSEWAVLQKKQHVDREKIYFFIFLMNHIKFRGSNEQDEMITHSVFSGV